jgi:hypothetical protein
VSQASGMTDVEMLVELQAIYQLKAVRDHAVDQKDCATYAELHTGDYVATSTSSEPIIGGNAAAEALSVQLANVRSPGTAIMAADYSGENPLVGVG